MRRKTGAVRIGRMPGPAVLALLAVLLAAPAAAGTIRMAGTGGAIGGMRPLVEAFEKSHPGAVVVIPSVLGSGGAIRALLDGKLDVALSARPLKDEERRGGLEEAAYARTPFIFAVHGMTRISNLTSADLAGIFEGTKTAWPDGTPVRPILRPSTDADVETVRGISPRVAAALDKAMRREGMILAMSDREVADLLERNRGTFGALTLSLVEGEKRHVRVLSFNGVRPDAQALAEGRYPLSRTFTVVWRKGSPPEVCRFIKFVRSKAGMEILSRAGHVPSR